MRLKLVPGQVHGTRWRVSPTCDGDLKDELSRHMRVVAPCRAAVSSSQAPGSRGAPSSTGVCCRHRRRETYPDQPIWMGLLVLAPLQVTVTVPVPGRVVGPMLQLHETIPFASADLVANP
jgi:hypothetical protein